MPKIKESMLFIRKKFLFAFLTFCLLSQLHTQYLEPPTIPSNSIKVPLPNPEVSPSVGPILPNDSVRSLRAEISPRDANTVILTWQAPPIRDDYIVARATAPIATLDLLLAAKSIAVLPPGVNTYLDQALEPGSYYYAVVPRRQVRERSVVLVVGENYTGTPVVILQRPVEERKEIPPPQVSLILAQAEKDGIRLSWKGVATPGVNYIIYRATTPFSDPEIFRTLNPLVILGQGQEVYLDRDLPGPGTYYYAVVTRSPTGAQDLRLVPDQSYTRYGVEWGNVGLPTVQGLKALYDPQKKEVELQWQDILGTEDAPYYYEIYRFLDPLMVKQIENAERRGRVPVGVGSFRDKLPEPKNYYYAVITRLAGKKQMSSLTLGENLVLLTFSDGKLETEKPREKSPNEITFEKTSVYFEKFSAQLDKYAIFLSWKVTKNLFEKSQIFLYRLSFAPKSLADLANGELIARLAKEQEMYEDIPPQKGVYYYAIFGQAQNGGLLPDTIEGGHNLVGPIYFDGATPTKRQPILESDVVTVNEKPEETESLVPQPAKTEKEPLLRDESQLQKKALADILQNYFKQGYYRETIFRLTPIAKQEKAEIKAMALFYLGMSHFHLGEYREAIDFFIHPQVVKMYGKKAKFWYERSLERLK